MICYFYLCSFVYLKTLVVVFVCLPHFGFEYEFAALCWREAKENQPKIIKFRPTLLCFKAVRERENSAGKP